MIKVIDNNRSPRRGPITTWLGLRASFFFLILLSGYSPAASSDFDAEACEQVQNEFEVQLSRKFRSTDKKGLADRRKAANNLLESVSSPCAYMLLYKLAGTAKHGDPALQEMFYERLATSTMKQFAETLTRRTCCADDDIEHWGRKFETDAERIAYIENYFDEYFDDNDIGANGTQNQSADADVQCALVRDEVEVQLRRKFRSTDKKGLADRRKKLNELFENTSRECVYNLLYWLGNEKHGDKALQKLFHGRLASPTRKQLHDILIRKSREFASEEVSDGTSKTIRDNAAERRETYS